MLFKGIIITGTSCSGKSSIAQKLQEQGNGFNIVEAVTTRAPRADDSNYEYCSVEEFEQLSKKNKLLVATTYRNKSYGIKNEKYNSILRTKTKVPLLILTPSSAIKLLETHKSELMCLFIDAPDNILEKRLKERDIREFTDEDKKQIEDDRSFSSQATYIIQNNDLKYSISLIEWLWEHQNQGGGLSQGIIELMLGCGMLLEHSTQSGIKGASYDLLLGDEYYYAGEVKRLSDANPFLTIEPYDYAIVSCNVYN